MTASPALPKTRPNLARRATSSRYRRAVLVMSIAVAAVFVVTLCLGDTVFSPAEALRVITGQTVPGASFTIGELRLPRALNAVLVGVAFGMSGTIFQTILRNVLASPDVIGVTAGASASAVIAIAVVGASGALLSSIALVGALAAALAMYLLASRGGLSGYRFILIGIGVAAMLQAVVSYVLTRSSIGVAEDALIWLTGSLNRSLWNQVPTLAGALVVLIPAAIVLARPLGILQLGDDAATALGARVQRTRLLLIVVAVALAAVATAAAGPVAFVALLCGPIARRVSGSSGAALLPSALAGALIMLVADYAGQHLLGTRFPVGVITGIIGAPYLLWLLASTNRKGTRV